MVVRLLADREPYASYAKKGDPTGSLSFCPGAAEEANTEGSYHVDLEVMPADRYLALTPAHRPACPVFAYGSVSLMAAAYEAGCADYLRDPWSLVELTARANRLDILRFACAGIALELRGGILSMENGRDGSQVALGEADRKLLRLLIRNAGRTVPRKAIELELWDNKGRSRRAPDVSIARLRARLDSLVPGGGTVIKSCRGLGYRLDT